MGSKKRVGVLLVNTGTPDEPTSQAVRAYLGRFLMDPHICPLNRVLWWLILHLFILPKRAPISAEKYASIWTDQGSPFTLVHEELVDKLNTFFQDTNEEVVVKQAMSYSAPFVFDALKDLREEKCTRLLVLPLYPQSAYSTTSSVCDQVKCALASLGWEVSLTFKKSYHDEGFYIRALAASLLAKGFKPASEDRVLFSYHSIPLVDVQAGDTYNEQTQHTSALVAQELGINSEQWAVGYQCRFDKGRDWLSPFTSKVLDEWAQKPPKRLFFICPNFAVDCLETLFDIEHELKPYYYAQMPNRDAPLNKAFVYVPCLGKSQTHVDVLGHIIKACLKEG